MNLKKILLTSVACVAALSLFAACNKTEETQDSAEPSVIDENNIDAEIEENIEDLEGADETEADEATSGSESDSSVSDSDVYDSNSIEVK